MPLDLESRYLGCLLGLACGDAVGTTVEFKPRGSFEPLTDMVGGGPFGLAPGQWTDDTSMALCLAESLLARNGFDPVDQMSRYLNWWRWGYLSSTGSCFDIETLTAAALIEGFERLREVHFAPSPPSPLSQPRERRRRSPLPPGVGEGAGGWGAKGDYPTVAPYLARARRAKRALAQMLWMLAEVR